MAFCQSFMTELCKYIGADTDVPAEISEQEQERSGICLDNTRESVGVYEGVLTGKD